MLFFRIGFTYDKDRKDGRVWGMSTVKVMKCWSNTNRRKDGN